MNSSVFVRHGAVHRPASFAKDSFHINAESPFKSAPVIYEVVRSKASKLMFETALLRKKVEASAPCFAIRTRGFDDLSLMVEPLPREVWNIVCSMLAPENIMAMFSTCNAMQNCIQAYIRKAEARYQKTTEKILKITNVDFSTDKVVEKKLQKLFNKNNFLKVSFSRCIRKRELLHAISRNSDIKLLHIKAKNISKHIDGATFGASFQNLSGATISLDISDNNFWKNDDLSKVFHSIICSHSVQKLYLDFNIFKEIERSQIFFRMLLSERSRINELSLKGTTLRSCLSDFGMCLLAYCLALNKPHLLRRINLCNTSVKPGPLSSPKDFVLFDYLPYDAFLHAPTFIPFSHEALKIKGKSGLQLVIESLKKNRTITAINLSCCAIDNKITKIIADSLDANRTLRELYLDSNLIGNKGISILGKAIGQHPSLTVTSLSSNEKIGEKGWVEFFNSLSGNTRLHHLNLAACSIGNKGEKALADMLKLNATLKELILSNTPISIKGLTELVSSLKGHPSIKLLDLAGNRILFKHLPMLEHLVSGGMQVRVTAGAQYKEAKANGISLEKLDDANINEGSIESEDMWLEASW